MPPRVAREGSARTDPQVTPQTSTIYYDKVVKNHLSLKTLEAHLPEIKSKRLVLTHMSDDMLRRLDTLGYTTASDGMIVEL